MTDPIRVGLIVNPIAGLGGSIGMKGTDLPEALLRARELGALPHSAERAQAALETLVRHFPGDLDILTPPGSMGEDVARSAGFEPMVVGDRLIEGTTAEDTKRAARMICDQGIDLLLFAGGDGTARDIFTAISPGSIALGIPTGVKMHSAVYATNPRSAGEAAARFLASQTRTTREAEVMDIDESEFRNGRVSARIYGTLRIPDQPRLMQHVKSGSSQRNASALAGIADDIAERMRDGALYIIGPGSTTSMIAERLGGPNTLLGVDLYCRGEAVALDVTEEVILHHLEGTKGRIVVTPIGGQGFLFGRGNQQISAQVIQKVGRSNILVVSTVDKIAGLKGDPFLVDTGDLDTDRLLAGYIRVITGYHTETVHPVG